jgi:hypothetical protein
MINILSKKDCLIYNLAHNLNIKGDTRIVSDLHKLSIKTLLFLIKKIEHK